MAIEAEDQSSQGLLELKQALNTAVLELQYERSLRAVENVNKDEEIRKLKCENLLLDNGCAELQDQLSEEEELVDELERSLQAVQAGWDESLADVQRLTNDLRAKTRDLETMKAEINSLQNVSFDSTKLLTEKLALAHELSTLKPELEHLRSQSASYQDTLSGKLALQRQVDAVQVELENANRTLQGALAKETESKTQEAAHLAQIEELRSLWNTEKRERERLEKEGKKAEAIETERKTQDAAHLAQVEELRLLWNKEKRERERLEKEAKKAETKETENKTQDAAHSAQIEEIRLLWNKEKRERERLEKEAKKAVTDWEAQKSILDDKLNQFRNKLKTTKEKLKDTESELQKAQAEAAAAVSRAAVNIEPGRKLDKPARNVRKRPAAQMDPDAAIGTPGEGMAAKRGKRASSAVPGDKSTFSITPYLNRTRSVAPESPPKDSTREAAGEDDVEDKPSGENSPSAGARRPIVAAVKGTSNAKPKPLASATSKANAKPAARRKGKAAVPALAKVAEEGEDGKEGATATLSAVNDQENANPDPISGSAQEPGPSKPVLKKTAPKALTSFASFNDSELNVEHRKKRKLPGDTSLLGKTLFDDEDSQPQSKGLGFGGFGPFGARKILGGYAGRGLLGPGRGKGGLLGKGRIGGLITAEDGFQFSPLKKDRRKALVEE